jgi:Domain of unknown function (DUF4442)
LIKAKTGIQMAQKDFFTLVNSRLKFRLFMLAKLPSAFFSGVRVRYADEGKCITSVPYRWFSQNPFKSTYFACQSMAAEMSTGLLGLAHVYKRNPAVSMLVVKMEANFLKKATGLTTFVCNDGLAIKNAIEEAIATGGGKTITVKSAGSGKDGAIIAEFFFTWSFKAKTK